MSQLDKFAVVICSRLSSKRLPGKFFLDINGKTVADHLIDRLQDFEVHLSVPTVEVSEYMAHEPTFEGRAFISCGSEENPLARMQVTAETHDIEYIIRITHDKIFLDPEVIKSACNYMKHHPSCGYLYSSALLDGCGFEIIHKSVLNYAAMHYGVVEHISYAAKAACKDLKLQTHDFQKVPPHVKKLDGQNHRLLIDYPVDAELMELILNELGNNVETKDVVSWLNGDGCIYSKINKRPLITIYTCAYNAEDYIVDCISSVMNLAEWNDIEYIIVDDASTDNTDLKVKHLPYFYDNVKLIKNDKNKGLSSSCNIALKAASSNYIMRLDADDYLVASSITPYIAALSATGADYLTPSFISQRHNCGVVKAEDNEHLGGTIFKTNAVNHVKFTDGLRGYDNLDFFKRSANVLEGSTRFTHPPLFFYRDTEGSLSNSNHKERAKLKEVILNGT